MESYIGINNVSKKIKSVYVGVNGAVRKVKEVYVGVNGTAKCVYRSNIEVEITVSKNVDLEVELNSKNGQLSIFGEFSYSGNDPYIVISFSPPVCLFGGYMEGFVEVTSDVKNTDYHIQLLNEESEIIRNNNDSYVEYGFPVNKLVTEIDIVSTYSGEAPDTVNADFCIRLPESIYANKLITR